MNAEAITRRRWWILGILSMSLLVIGLDNTILNVALPTLQRQLDPSSSQLQWIVDSYMLVFAGVLLTAGSLGDRFGRRRALFLGLAIFATGSLAAAFSGGAATLIASRALMGLGAAFIMPSTLSILTNVFPAEERARAIAIWAGVSGLGIAIGPVTGGFLLEHFWWGSVFLVNVPFVVFTLVAGFALVPESRDPNATRLDPLGAGLSIAGLTALVWGVIEAPSHGWTSRPILIAFAAALAILSAFIAWELTTSSPMLEMRFFRNSRFSAASASVSLVFFSLMGTIFFLTTYLQSVLGYGALAAGVRVIPISAALMVGAGISTKLDARVGTKIVVTGGLGLVAVGLWILSLATATSGYELVALSLVVTGLGMGAAMAPATESIMGSLPLAKASVGSAMNDTTRMVGGALGVAVLGSILSSRYAPHMNAAVADLRPADAHAAHDRLEGALAVASHTPGAAGQALAVAARHAFVTGMSETALVAAAVALAGAALALVFLPARSRPSLESVDVAKLETAELETAELEPLAA